MTSVNKILNNTKGVDKMKEQIKKTLQFSIFILIVASPFISVTQIMGMEIFLDSFENPEYYLSLKYNNNDKNYLIIQKSNHPDFNIKENDVIIYSTESGSIAYDTIHEIQSMGTLKRYYITSNKEQNNEAPIYQFQIIGKVVKTVEDNIWNSISIKVWETSINTLNIRALTD